MKRLIALAFVHALATGLTPAPAALEAASSEPFIHFMGGMHTHTGYSDGTPGTRPADAYARARDVESLAFMSVTEHSEALPVPMTLSGGCLADAAALADCAFADEPITSLDKWGAQGRQAEEESRPGSYVALRGFEWTSDTFDHINVYFSRNYTTRLEGGEVLLESFYQWLRTPPDLGGGADGLATFNHPGLKRLHPQDSRAQWHDYAYVPDLEDRIVGVEILSFGSRSYEPGAVRALDRGWRLGFLGAEDTHDDDWGAPRYPRTVYLMHDLSEEAIREAMLARRSYATLDHGIRIDFTADGEPMGSRIRTAAPSAALEVEITGGTVSGVELVSNGGAVVASTTSRQLHYDAPAGPEERYYFVRVVGPDGRAAAYASPVWVAAEAP